MITTRRSFATLLFSLVLCHLALAQTPRETALPIDAPPARKQLATLSSTPIVTATASSQRVRYVSMGEVNQTRLQVFSTDGTQVFDSDFKLGNLIDWQLQDHQGSRLINGSYLFLVTVKDFSGTLTQKYGTAVLEPEQVYLEQTARDELASAQATALEANRQSEVLSPVDRIGATGLNRATTTLADGSTPIDAAPSGKQTSTPKTPVGENVIGTGTQNKLAKWMETGGSGTLGDSNVTELGGNVGIGVTNPTYKLVVGPDIGPGLTTSDLTISRGPGQSVSIFAGATGAHGMNFGWDEANQRAFVNAPVASPITFTHGGVSERMRIETNGNVGVGTTAPQRALHVSKASTPEIAISSSGNAVGTKNFQFQLDPSGNLNFHMVNDAWNSVTAQMTMRRDGNLGIGTTNPQSKLEVHGDIRLGPSGQYRATSGEENLRIIRGVVDQDGNILEGEGFTVSHPSEGRYTILFNTGFSHPPSITAMGHYQGAIVSDEGVTSNDAKLVVLCGGCLDGTIFSDAFHFIAIGPR